MNGDRDYIVDMLCRQLIGMRDPSGQEPRGLVDDAAGAKVSIELQGMVKTIRRQLWIDNASYTKRIADEIERQVNAIDLQAEIVKAVKGEIERALIQLSNTVREQVTSIVREEVRQRVGELPARIARKFTRKFWEQAFAKDDDL